MRKKLFKKLVCKFIRRKRYEVNSIVRLKGAGMNQFPTPTTSRLEKAVFDCAL
jgi:hypothetical protein